MRDPFPVAARALFGSLRHDPSAKRGFDVFSGGFVWSDEVSRDVDAVPDTVLPLRQLIDHRAALTNGTTSEHAEVWAAVERLYPDWPGLRPERRDAELAVELAIELDAAIEDLEAFEPDAG